MLKRWRFLRALERGDCGIDEAVSVDWFERGVWMEFLACLDQRVVGQVSALSMGYKERCGGVNRHFYSRFT